MPARDWRLVMCVKFGEGLLCGRYRFDLCINKDFLQCVRYGTLTGPLWALLVQHVLSNTFSVLGEHQRARQRVLM